MQAVTLAAGAAALVAVPLAVYLAWASRAQRRRDRRVSEQRRSAETAIRLTEGGRERRKGSGTGSRSGSRSRSAPKPSIDLFKGQAAQSAAAERPKEADPQQDGG